MNGGINVKTLLDLILKQKEQLQKEDYFNGLFRIQDDDGDENVIREVDRDQMTEEMNR